MKKLVFTLLLPLALFSCKDDSKKIIGTWDLADTDCEIAIVFDSMTFTENEMLSGGATNPYLLDGNIIRLDMAGLEIQKLTKKKLRISPVGVDCCMSYERVD